MRERIGWLDGRLIGQQDVDRIAADLTGWLAKGVECREAAAHGGCGGRVPIRLREAGEHALNVDVGVDGLEVDVEGVCTAKPCDRAAAAEEEFSAVHRRGPRVVGDEEGDLVRLDWGGEGGRLCFHEEVGKSARLGGDRRVDLNVGRLQRHGVSADDWALNRDHRIRARGLRVDAAVDIEPRRDSDVGSQRRSHRRGVGEINIRTR